MNEVPMYSGFASDSRGRILDQTSSAPTRMLVVTVASSAKISSGRPSTKDLDVGDLASSLNHLVGQGVEQDPKQVYAERFGTTAAGLKRTFDQVVPTWQS
jgi:hypothetical protein